MKLIMLKTAVLSTGQLAENMCICQNLCSQSELYKPSEEIDIQIPEYVE
jgi:hypothetical protein